MINPQQFDQLLYLADQLETGDHFEMNVRDFLDLTNRIKNQLYRHCRDREVLDALDGLPVIETQAYRRSFLEQMLPKAGRDMVGKYKNREVIREQVRETVRTLSRIRRWLGEDDELV